jgi:hypothetical protein
LAKEGEKKKTLDKEKVGRKDNETSEKIIGLHGKAFRIQAVHELIRGRISCTRPHGHFLNPGLP